MSLGATVERGISSVAEFVGSVVEARNSWFPSDKFPELWFRGSNDGRLKLLPGAYWRTNCDENSLALSFRSMVPTYVTKEPLDEWEWYYLMQHYGLPTRLLDWTESALAALYFAIWRPDAPAPAVWLLDPVTLNVLNHGASEEAIIVPTSTPNLLFHWLPGNCGRGLETKVFKEGSRFIDNSQPIAIFPKRNNPRIVAQRGTFTIHGTSERPLEELIAERAPAGCEPRVRRLFLDPLATEKLLSELHTLGVTKAALFPEPQSIAEDLKKQYGLT